MFGTQRSILGQVDANDDADSDVDDIADANTIAHTHVWHPAEYTGPGWQKYHEVDSDADC